MQSGRDCQGYSYHQEFGSNLSRVYSNTCLEKATLTFSRTHADIKPENILFVQGEFKLADPGFMKFHVSDQPGKIGQAIKEVIEGGTWTYGIRT